MKKTVGALALFCLVCPAAGAGVVIEMEVRDPGSGGEPAMDKIYAQGEMLRMDPHPTKGTDRMSMVFRDDTLWIVNHDQESCQMIDKQDVERLSSQLGAAMKQMEAELSKLPPEQRAMMEKMMKSKMPAGMPGMGKPAAARRVEAGATERVGEYSCTQHTFYSGDEKAWEVCAAPHDLLGAASEAMGAFQAMSRFAEQLQESVRQGPFAGMIDTPFQHMDEIDGFPVRVRVFDNGRLTSETTLKSATGRELDDAVFSPPEGYRVGKLSELMNRGR